MFNVWLFNQEKTYVYDTRIFEYFFIQGIDTGYGIFGYSEKTNIILGKFSSEERAKKCLKALGAALADSNYTKFMIKGNNEEEF